MSLVGNTLKMANLLQSRGKMKSSELAEILEVSERQIRKYRSDLEQAGIFINSTSGAYGGYELMSQNLLGFNLSKEDFMILEIVSEQFKEINNIYSKDFNAILELLRAHCNTKGTGIENINHFTIQPKLNCNQAVEKEKYKILYAACMGRNKVEINYNSLMSGKKTRIIQPYGLFYYKENLYLIAYCERRQGFADFKVCRIESYEVLEEKFKVDKGFNWKKYSQNTIGIFKDEEIDLVLKVQHPFSVIIKEKIWVDNQRIEDLEDGNIVFKARIKGYPEVKSWILSMGAKVEVLAPERLREDIRNEVMVIKDMYEVNE